MDIHNSWACEELLLDVVFYEKRCGRLSPEMEYLLECHLESCPSCRARELSFRRVLHGEDNFWNFG